jgi:cyclophilin family peptidyl-prolyl cis-trans isomerase
MVRSGSVLLRRARCRGTSRRLVCGAFLLLLLGGCAVEEAGEPPRREVVVTGPYYRVVTDMGAFAVGLDTLRAPLSAQRFSQLAACGGYDGAPFSRRVPGEFVVLGGLAAPELKTDSLELDPKTGVHAVGTLGMVRSEDPEAAPGEVERARFLRSARGEFFICLGREAHLDGKYSAFAKVLSGLPVVRALGNVKRSAPDPRILRVVPVDTLITDGPK